MDRLWEAVTEPEDRVCGTNYYTFSPFVAIVVMFNSSINCVIYVICGRRFRRRLLGMLRAAFRGKKVEPYIPSGTATTNRDRETKQRGPGNRPDTSTGRDVGTKQQRPSTSTGGYIGVKIWEQGTSTSGNRDTKI